MLKNIFIGVLIYHTILTIFHRTTKKKSCLLVNTIRFPFLYLISVCDFLAAALAIKITKAADVWGRKGWWWPLKSHSRFSYSDILKKNITHISLSTFAKIFVQTFFFWSLNILVKQILPLPPSPFPLPQHSQKHFFTGVSISQNPSENGLVYQLSWNTKIDIAVMLDS